MCAYAISRRDLLRASAITAAGAALAACQPEVVEVEKVVKETVEVDREVTRVIEQQVEKAVEKVVTATPGPQQVAQIRYISWWVAMTEQLAQPYYEEVFKPTHSNIDLTFEVVPYDEYHRIVPTNIAAGTLADTIHINANQHMKYYDSGEILDISDHVGLAGYDLSKDFFLTGAEIWCGRVMAMPSTTGLYVMFYNKSLLQKEWGKDIWDDLNNKYTFDDFAEACQLCTKDTNGDGHIDQFGVDLGYTSLSNNNMWCWAMGVDIVDWQNMKTQFTNPTVIEAHKMIEDWIKNKKIAVPAEAVAEASQLGLPSIFAGGKVAFWIRALDSAAAVRTYAVAENYFDWDIASMPWYDDSHPGIQLSSGNPYCVYAKTKYPAESFEWISKLATDGMMWQSYQEKTFTPAWYRALAVWLKQEPPPKHLSWIPDAFEQGYGIHFRMWTKEAVDRIYKDAMERVFIEGADMEEILSDLDAQINPEVKYGDCNPYQGVTIPMRSTGLKEAIAALEK